jgi:hypothetical protein
MATAAGSGALAFLGGYRRTKHRRRNARGEQTASAWRVDAAGRRVRSRKCGAGRCSDPATQFRRSSAPVRSFWLHRDRARQDLKSGMFCGLRSRIRVTARHIPKEEGDRKRKFGCLPSRCRELRPLLRHSVAAPQAEEMAAKRRRERRRSAILLA